MLAISAHPSLLLSSFVMPFWPLIIHDELVSKVITNCYITNCTPQGTNFPSATLVSPLSDGIAESCEWKNAKDTWPWSNAVPDFANNFHSWVQKLQGVQGAYFAIDFDSKDAFQQFWSNYRGKLGEIVRCIANVQVITANWWLQALISCSSLKWPWCLLSSCCVLHCQRSPYLRNSDQKAFAQFTLQRTFF